jgi:type 2 lantibiotic biosynthesis protein LanM
MPSSTLLPALDSDVLKVALRASNFAERHRIVTSLRDQLPALPGGAGAADMNPLDAAWISATAAKLADQFAAGAETRDADPIYTVDQVTTVLSTFHRLEAAEPWPPALPDELASTHASWLPGYQRALSGFGQASTRERTAWWRDPRTYYGQAAVVCAPFLALLEAELSAADPAGRPAPTALLEGIQRHLLRQFELAGIWAIEVHAKVHCAQHGIDPERASEDQYREFLDETFRDASGYHAFFNRFPMLGRWLAEVTSLLTEAARRLWSRLTADEGLLVARLLGAPVNAYTAFDFGQGDSHGGGNTVVRISAKLADGVPTEFIYKPRCVRAEAGMQTLITRLRDDGALTAAPRTVLPMSGYGYEEVIPADRNSVTTKDEAEQVYRELGGYLAVFYVLGGGDLHHENLIVATGHVHICDCETVFGLLLAGDLEDRSGLLDSVFRTGLLEWPSAARPDAEGGEMRISGYAGGEEFELPVPVPRPNTHRLSFKSAVHHQSGIRVTPTTTNRVFLNGTMTQPQDYTASIQAGFDAVYTWFQDSPRRASDVVAASFAGASTRYIRWSTQIYHQFLAAVRHPQCMIDPLESDLIINRLHTLPPRPTDDPRMLAAELAALWRWDVPLFSARITDHALRGDQSPAPVAELIRPPLAAARARIGNLSAQNRRQQAAYVAASLATSAHDQALAEACVVHAVRIGERLVRMCREPDAPAPWTAYRVSGSGLDKMDIEADLYNGSAGVALFLAYLDAVSPDPAVRQTAERATEDALARFDRTRIGAFTGAAGMIYLLTHVGTLWRRPDLVERAVRLSAGLGELIDGDRHHDVFAGCAGVIPVLLGLAEHADGAGLDMAERCAAHLLQQAHDTDGTLSWPAFDPSEVHADLTGLAHGAGGIAWSLIALGRRLGRDDLIDAGRRAFRYEARHFDAAERDWPDLRIFAAPANQAGKHYANAWCNGASGIGLSRIAAWHLLGDDDLLTDAQVALSTTIRKYRHLGNNTLCHGKCGNAELLVRYAQLRDEPAFRLEAGVQAQEQWRDVDGSRFGATDDTTGFFPGLMLGISGFGMHYLRLAHPDRVPSVLLLDPPPGD